MKKIVFLITLCILISCKRKLDSKVEKSLIQITKQTCILSDWIFQTPEYIDLMNVSTNDDLVYLTNDENPNVRYYAFIGLLERNHPKVREIYNLHKNDSTTICTSNGACLKNSIPINSLMKDAISSESIYTAFFRKNKYHSKTKK